MKPDIKEYANSVYPIDTKIRQLMQTIWAGTASTDIYGPAMHYLDCHFPKNKIELALSWLVSNKLIGKRFDEFFQDDCRGSNLQLHSRLLAQVEKMPRGEARRIIAGRDFV